MDDRDRLIGVQGSGPDADPGRVADRRQIAVGERLVIGTDDHRIVGPLHVHDRIARLVTQDGRPRGTRPIEGSRDAAAFEGEPRRWLDRALSDQFLARVEGGPDQCGRRSFVRPEVPHRPAVDRQGEFVGEADPDSSVLADVVRDEQRGRDGATDQIEAASTGQIVQREGRVGRRVVSDQADATHTGRSSGRDKAPSIVGPVASVAPCGPAIAIDFGADRRPSRVPPGTYTLIVDLATDRSITVGALGERSFPAGAYAYVGSAFGPGGLARVERHRELARGERSTRHWHIDYLLGDRAASIAAVVTTPNADIECVLARSIDATPVAAFGASDCDCETHLFRADDPQSLRANVSAAHDAAGDDG